jgi:septum formation protein
MTTFILASSSPRRRELLDSLGISFEVNTPDIDETQKDDEKPEDYVQRLSKAKALAVVKQVKAPALILAADTIVIDGTTILGKPADAAEARQMLQQLRSRTHRVCTAITLHKLGDKTKTITKMDSTEVQMRAYTDDEIESYIQSGDPFDKAGGYAIQDEKFIPVVRIDGSYSSVMGLPLELLQTALKEIGWKTPEEASA